MALTENGPSAFSLVANYSTHCDSFSIDAIDRVAMVACISKLSPGGVILGIFT